MPIKNLRARKIPPPPPQVPSRYFRACSCTKISNSVSEQESLPSTACFVQRACYGSVWLLVSRHRIKFKKKKCDVGRSQCCNTARRGVCSSYSAGSMWHRRAKPSKMKRMALSYTLSRSLPKYALCFPGSCYNSLSFSAETKKKKNGVKNSQESHHPGHISH